MSKKGRFGDYGGQYVPEIVMPALNELEEAYLKYRDDAAFQAEYRSYLKEYAGRPTNLYFAERLTKHYGKADIYLKREDLLHTGAHKINNALGQALLAHRMGKKRIIAETGAGQHGVATATVAALFGMECRIFMGALDVERQKLNVFRMRLLGATVVPVSSGTGTLKDATSEAIRYWATNITDTYYVIGSAVGPHPYPMMVRDFQKVIGEEIRAQAEEKFHAKPDYLVACIGGGSNAIGTIYDFRNDADVKKFCVEGGGRSDADGDNAKTLSGGGTPGILHGAYSNLLQNEDGQVIEAYSISAGLDYPGVGPEHSYFKDEGIVTYVSVTDREALDAFQRLSRIEGIIPALESSHALAYLETLMPQTKAGERVVVCLSGRGDKDVQMVAKELGEDDPDLESTKRNVRAAVAAGADLIELGIPFSDPTAEGPVIQAASVEALKNGMTMKKALEIVKEIRKHSEIPIVGMGYINMVNHYGFERFVTDFKEAGMDGVILPDVPHEESEEMRRICAAHDFTLTEFITPGTTEARMAETCRHAAGFVYCVSNYGVTGVKEIDYSIIGKVCSAARRYTDIPLAIGFGIGTPEAAARAAKQADGVIVGSAVVKHILDGDIDGGIQLIAAMRKALDA